MGLLELLLIALGLSMDAFAVAVCKGLGMRRFHAGRAALVAVFFGGFQALMPFLGWLLGRQFADYVQKWGHFISFALLLFIGGKMVVEALRNKDGCAACQKSRDACAFCKEEARFSIRELFLLAVATSIDALAVGVTFAFLRVSIAPAVALIGLVTFALSFLGVAVGNRFGARFEKRAEIAGGVVLILIGIKMLF